MKPSLLRALAAIALASFGFGCTSANSGAIGDTCLSALDCTSPYECLPIYPDLDAADLEHIIDAIRSVKSIQPAPAPAPNRPTTVSA